MSLFTDHCLSSSAELITLVELLVPQVRKGWQPLSNPTGVPYCVVYDKVSAVRVYDVSLGTMIELTEQASFSDCAAEPDSFYCEGFYEPSSETGASICGYFPRRLYVHLSSGLPTDLNRHVIITHLLTFSNSPQYIGNYYEPRLLEVPGAELAIDGRFENPSRRGGGEIVLNNRDLLFSRYPFADYEYNSATVTVRLGVNDATYVMDVADYVTLGTWSVETFDRNSSQLSLRTNDLKNDLEATVELTTLDTGKDMGKVIPLIYGEKYLVDSFNSFDDATAPIWKVSSGTISEIIDVWFEIKNFQWRTFGQEWSDQYWNIVSRLLRIDDKFYLRGTAFDVDLNEATFKATCPVTWLQIKMNLWAQATDPLSGTSYAADVNQMSVEFPVLSVHGANVFPFTGTEIYGFAPADSLADCVATSMTFWYERSTGILYEHGVNYTLDTVALPLFLGIDLAVSENNPLVDLRGVKDGLGNPKQSGATVIHDILYRVNSSIDIDSTSYFTAIDIERTGVDLEGKERFRIPLSIFVEENTSASDLLQRICQTEGIALAPLTVSTLRLIANTSQPASIVPMFDDTEIFEFNEVLDGETYNRATMPQNGTNTNAYPPYVLTHVTAPIVVQSDVDVELAAFRNPKSSEQIGEVCTPEVIDYYLQLKLTQHAKVPTQYRCQLSARIMGYNVGDFIYVESDRFDVQIVGQILEMKLSGSTKAVDVVLGDIYGVKHRAAFLSNTGDETLPERYVDEAGYGDGIAEWKEEWSDKLKRYARYAYGYQHDEATGMIISTDELSANTCGVM